MRVRRWTAVLCAVPLLAACTSGGTPGDEPSGSASPSADSSASAEPSESSLTATSCEDTVREPNELEASLLVEPGPYSGDAFDEDAVVQAVVAAEPTTAAEAHAALMEQIHGDYAAGICANLQFTGAIGDAAERPDETDGGPADTADDAPVGQNHFAVVLDASGSMAERSGGDTRMNAAKKAVLGFADTLPNSATMSVRVYGDEGSSGATGKDASCSSSTIVYEGAANRKPLAKALKPVQPVGWTPLARGIKQAANDIPDTSTEAIVYVVTDGQETCDGDPVAAAAKLAKTGVKPVINVIGFHVNAADAKALRAIARAGGGEYTQAQSARQLERYWAEEHMRMAKAWRKWREEETARITKEGWANATEARNVYDGLFDTTRQEYDQSFDIYRRLRKDEVLPGPTAYELLVLVGERRKQIHEYAAKTRWANMQSALITAKSYRDAIAREGHDRWLEHYRASSR